MQYLIIYGHPNPKSFNHAIKTVLETTLKSKGEVITRDLYSSGFDPLLSAGDLAGLQDGTILEDVKEEQAYVKRADTLFFVFPLWWGGPPAILKGYIDRIFCKGFAYDVESGRLQQLLPDKKFQMIVTLGESQKKYERSGMFDSLSQTMGDILADFSGMEFLPIKFFASVPLISDGERKKMLEEIKTMAQNS